MTGFRCALTAVLCSTIPLLSAGAPVSAQAAPPADSVVPLDALVVTADRVETPRINSIASVSVLTRDQLARTPGVTLADALRTVPGFALVDLDGLGRDPQLMLRGFYGGGEAEYVLVLVDGLPVNDLQTGLVSWDALPLAAVERVEVVRGGASALWGDAALAGVINVITRNPGERGTRWAVRGGSYGSWTGNVDAHARLGGHDVTLFGGVDRTTGFRANAERTTGRAGAAITLGSSPAGEVRLTATSHWREFDVPGPLAQSALDTDRSGSDVFYRFDRTEDRNHRLAIDATRLLGSRIMLRGSLAGELRYTDAVRTIALAPEFADTKARELESGRGIASAQLAIEGTGLPFDDRLVFGLDGAFGTLDSDYFSVLTGDRGMYAAATGVRGELDASGQAERSAAAAFAQYTFSPLDAVRISIGARADWLYDRFDPRTPVTDTSVEATHTALSPRIGVNVRYARGEQHDGHVWFSTGRSFKAPTLDQLFDQRRLPVPFPPYAITTSNALLEPQYGTSVEAGIYHGASFGAGAVRSELSLSVYRMYMQDELDFDLQTLRYVNIGESRHRGLEAGLAVHFGNTGSTHINYTLQDATAQVGEYAGNRLKAIPRHFLTGGATVRLIGAAAAGLLVTHAGDAFLDDANALELPAYTRVDMRLSYPISGLRLFLDVGNVFDREYSTTGFPDPSGAGIVYFHPAAGRTFALGMRGEL